LLLLIPFGSASADYTSTQKLIFQDFPQNFPNNLPAQRYGTSVAVDGDWMVVGSPGDATQSGLAYVYQRDAGAWVLRKTLNPSSSIKGLAFGYDVAIDGDVIVVSAFNAQISGTRLGQVQVFERNSGGADNWGGTETFNPVQPDTDFGASVAVSGNTMFVGAPLQGNTDTGAVVIYTRVDVHQHHTRRGFRYVGLRRHTMHPDDWRT